MGRLIVTLRQSKYYLRTGENGINFQFDMVKTNELIK